MIAEVLEYLNKYWVDTVESSAGYSFEIDGIVGSFSEDYEVGQYVSIDGSKLNDGVYKIVSKTSTKLTFAADTFIAEDNDNTVYVWGLMIPKSVLTLISEIDTYVVTAKTGIKSESQGLRSVTYAKGSGWEDAFSSRLKKYKAMYSDKLSYYDYNINTKV